MSKLDDYLQIMVLSVRANLESKSPELTKQAIKALFLELIDGTELLGPPHPQSSIYKDTLRKKVEEL